MCSAVPYGSKEEYKIRRVFPSTYCTDIVQSKLYSAASGISKSLSFVFMRITTFSAHEIAWLIGDGTSCNLH